MRVGLLLVGLALLVGCGSDSVEPQAVPTRTLVPPTELPETLTPALTPTALLAPSALDLPPTSTPVSALPPTVQQMLMLTQRDLIDSQSVHAAEIRLLGIDEVTWDDPSWGCASASEDHDDTSGYRFIFSIGPRVYVYHTDVIDTYFVCEDDDWLVQEGHPLPLDPIAEAMIDLAARDIPGEAVDLVSLLALDWPDSSLGCPQTDGEYEEAVTPGYRMVFKVGNDRIIYHTSTRTIKRCSLEDEVLPF